MINELLLFLGLESAEIPDSLLFVVASMFLLVGITEFFRLLDMLIDKASRTK